MTAKLKYIKRPVPKWIIDRIENEWAVLDNSSTLETISLPIKSLPLGVRAGDTLFKMDSKWYKDEADTNARAQDIAERFARIKEKSAKRDV
ncbi:MAG: DUF3006 domain-containing protein [Defluviitaleaceae bacterium]|nr:DUF3006 domain-containing protein [Defluviitaleaceae bacterium]